MIEEADAYHALLAVYTALENFKEIEPAADRWTVELRQDGLIAVDVAEVGVSPSTIIFSSAQDAADYYRAEYWLRKTFGLDFEWWPLTGRPDAPEN